MPYYATASSLFYACNGTQAVRRETAGLLKVRPAPAGCASAYDNMLIINALSVGSR